MTATGLIIAFAAFEMITGIEKPYLGIMTYFIFPGMLIFGLLLVPVGAWRVRQQRRKGVIEGLRRFRERNVSVLALVTWLGFRQVQIGSFVHQGCVLRVCPVGHGFNLHSA